jgi:hypothetical protein
MRYIVKSKQAGDAFFILYLRPVGKHYDCGLYVEQPDFDALSVGQEITVDVVPVPREVSDGH